jgi:nitrate/nitrite-specific signal transduction histidine kinase
MRPVDEGVSLSASLSRMVEQFQRDTSISATFSSTDFHDPDETEVSLEILQIVREALNNIQKHSGATGYEVNQARPPGTLILAQLRL